MCETRPKEFRLYRSCVHYILSFQRGRWLLSITGSGVARPTDQIVRSSWNVFAEAIKELVKLVLWSLFLLVSSIFFSAMIFGRFE